MYDGPEISDVKRLAVRPGDRLVLRCARMPSLQETAHIRAYMARFAGPDVPVLVLGPGEDVEVIGPPDGVHVELNGDPEPVVRMLRDYIRAQGGLHRVLGT